MDAYNYKYLILIAVLFFITCKKPVNLVESLPIDSPVPDYYFDSAISESVLRNYLARAITMSDMYNSSGIPYLTENIRMLTNINAKFIGRAVVLWGAESEYENIIADAAPLVAQTHSADQDLIIQGTIFEYITTNVNAISVPDWVFSAFSQPYTNRTFNFSNIASETELDFYGPGTSIPDITKPDTVLWYYYLAKLYIDIGIEAIHLGQLNWVAQYDTNGNNCELLAEKIRNYAHQNGRRNLVLLDAHTHGLVKSNFLLLDFHSSPMRMKEVTGSTNLECVLAFNHDNAIYGHSAGGVTPSGWQTVSLPYLVEFDHGYAYSYVPGACPLEECIWGYDEITWFALLSETNRNSFLKYAWDWLRQNDTAGYVQMPGLRLLQTTGETGVNWYIANDSDALSIGYNQEDEIKTIWANN